MISLRRLPLATGVTLNVAEAGEGPPIFFLHGFPESHRTWRRQIADLSADFCVIAPDQRGFGKSDLPDGVDSYKPDRAVEDLFALADTLCIDRFTLVGHDWGGAIAWLAALRRPERLDRLVIVNAPHPFVFQKSLIEDEAQRAASQYINLFRIPGADLGIKAMGLERFFEKSFAPHVDLRRIPPEERQAYLDDWGRPGALKAMLNWYRASSFVVPLPGVAAELPDWADAAFSKMEVPTLVVWGLRDKALLPVQLEGLGGLVPDLRLVLEPDAGHFIPWQRPEVVTSAIRDFMKR